METRKDEMEIDLIDLFYYLKKKIWAIVAAFLVFAILGAVFTTFFMQDEYTAKTRMYVLNRSSEAGISSSDYSISNYMVKDYEVLITGENVTREVIDRLHLDMSVSELAGKISVSAIENTRILQIIVVDNDAKRAAAIANCVREISSAQIKEIMDVDAVNLVYEAEVPAGKSGPNMTQNMIIAAVLGVVLAIGVLVVVYMLDDTIRTDEDVTRFLGLDTLGVIPMSKELETMINTGLNNAKKNKLAGNSKHASKN